MNATFYGFFLCFFFPSFCSFDGKGYATLSLWTGFSRGVGVLGVRCCWRLEDFSRDGCLLNDNFADGHRRVGLLSFFFPTDTYMQHLMIMSFTGFVIYYYLSAPVKRLSAAMYMHIYNYKLDYLRKTNRAGYK